MENGVTKTAVGIVFLMLLFMIFIGTVLFKLQGEVVWIVLKVLTLFFWTEKRIYG